ncbi:MAG: zf-TFIIB domain-containing protein [Elusimicrobia bacterium]|nr:zf-TFIIB domain-containing protein [Elusimicrobiota bacterium]
MRDPFTWLLAQLGTSMGPVIAIALILLLVFWGRILGLLRRLILGLRQTARRAAHPGAKLCADCAAELGEPEGETAWRLCPACQGAWLKERALAARLSALNKPAKEWVPEAGKEILPCPDCSKPLEAGRLKGEDFAVYRCAPCAGLWLGRVERISLELRVLG